MVLYSDYTACKMPLFPMPGSDFYVSIVAFFCFQWDLGWVTWIFCPFMGVYVYCLLVAMYTYIAYILHIYIYCRVSEVGHGLYFVWDMLPCFLGNAVREHPSLLMSSYNSTTSPRKPRSARVWCTVTLGFCRVTSAIWSERSRRENVARSAMADADGEATE